IAWCRSLPSQKWLPVVVEISKYSLYVDRCAADRYQSAVFEQLREALRMADRETDAFVEWTGALRIKLHRGIPKLPHQLHASRIVSHIACDNSAVADDPPHLPHGGQRLRDKAQDQPTDRCIESFCWERESLGVPDDER